jgi:hypothetical protein
VPGNSALLHNMAAVYPAPSRMVRFFLSTAPEQTGRSLQFHNLTLQTPTTVWMAVDQTSREQELDGQALRVLKFAGRKFSDGIGWHRIDDRDIKVYNPAKTIVDCFVFRQKVGLGVFFEGLRQGLSQGSVTPEQLYQYSQPSAVWPVLQQYVKTVASDIG